MLIFNPKIWDEHIDFDAHIFRSAGEPQPDQRAEPTFANAGCRIQVAARCAKVMP